METNYIQVTDLDILDGWSFEPLLTEDKYPQETLNNKLKYYLKNRVSAKVWFEDKTPIDVTYIRSFERFILKRPFIFPNDENTANFDDDVKNQISELIECELLKKDPNALNQKRLINRLAEKHLFDQVIKGVTDFHISKEWEKPDNTFLQAHSCISMCTDAKVFHHKKGELKLRFTIGENKDTYYNLLNGSLRKVWESPSITTSLFAKCFFYRVDPMKKEENENSPDWLSDDMKMYIQALFLIWLEENHPGEISYEKVIAAFEKEYPSLVLQGIFTAKNQNE